MDPYNTADQFGAPNAARPSVVTPSASNPYAAPRAAVRDVSEHGDLVPASRLGRLGAVLIDTAIVALPAMLIAITVPAFADYTQRSATGAPSTGLGTGGSILLALWGLAMIAFVVYQFILLYRHGQTVGKKIVGIRIVRPDGSRVSFPRLLGLRYVVPGVIGVIPYVGWIFSLADPLFIFAEDRRTLHDRIADTIVVNT